MDLQTGVPVATACNIYIYTEAALQNAPGQMYQPATGKMCTFTVYLDVAARVKVIYSTCFGGQHLIS